MPFMNFYAFSIYYIGFIAILIPIIIFFSFDPLIILVDNLLWENLHTKHDTFEGIYLCQAFSQDKIRPYLIY